jgi:hypothetical protein
VPVVAIASSDTLTSIITMRVPFALGVLLCGGLQAVQAVRVYMSPAQGFFQAPVSPEEASVALSRHLGLESFESFQEGSPGAYTEESFVGQDAKNSLIITVEETDAGGAHVSGLCSGIPA